MKGMEYKDRSSDKELLEELIESDGWWFQQKMDGTRAMVDLETLQFNARRGTPLKHTAATQWIPQLLRELSDLGLSGMANTILDCELMIGDGELCVFDVIDKSLPAQPLYQRTEALEALPRGHRIQKVTTARSAAAKRELVQLCIGGEGVVAKDMTARYEPGVRTDRVLKFKNVHSAELVVTRLSASPLSAGLGIVTERDGAPLTVASASMIGKDPLITVGDVVEVEYLAWTGTSLLQPRIKRRRPDKIAGDCTARQFKTYSREAVL